MEHIFNKIILNIYFDHIHLIMCLYRVFSVHCTHTGYIVDETKNNLLINLVFNRF
jgi:hypothetical protein